MKGTNRLWLRHGVMPFLDLMVWAGPGTAADAGAIIAQRGSAALTSAFAVSSACLTRTSATLRSPIPHRCIVRRPTAAGSRLVTMTAAATRLHTRENRIARWAKWLI